MLTIIARRRERSTASGHDYRLRNKPFMVGAQVADFAFMLIEIMSDLRAHDHDPAVAVRNQQALST